MGTVLKLTVAINSLWPHSEGKKNHGKKEKELLFVFSPRGQQKDGSMIGFGNSDQ